MKGLLADVRHAFRLYCATPGSSLIAVVVLAIGMAFVGAFLSLYVDLLLKPHPGIDESERIVTIGQVDGTRMWGFTPALIERVTSEVTSLEAAIGTLRFSMPVGLDNETWPVEAVTAGFFEEFRPRLALGRGFLLPDYTFDAEPVVVISDRYWREVLEASPDVLDTLVEMQSPFSPVGEDDEDPAIELRVVGIMAPELRGLLTDQTAFWTPFEPMVPIMFNTENPLPVLTTFSMPTLARLSDGASTESVIRELEARYPESTEEFRRPPGLRMAAVPGLVNDINVYRDAERQLNLFLAGSVLLALVAAANVSLFLLARAPGRRRELAIRMSVGAPTKRLARQLASEAGVLVVVSAALGLLASVWLVNLLRGLAFLRQAEWSDVTLLDWRVLGLVVVFLLVLTTLVSLAPILGLKRLGIASSSRQVAARASLAQRIAGTMQIAIAGALGGAGIAFGWYLGSMTLGFPGYETENRYQFRFSPFVVDESGASRLFPFSGVEATRARDVIETLPGVTGVTLASLVPTSQSAISTRQVTHPADPTREVTIGHGGIDSAFVDILGLKLIHGRAPGPSEWGVALVNQSMARLFFGRENVVGESLDTTNITGDPRAEIVGVLEDLSFVHPAADVEPIVFVNIAPNAFGMAGVIESSLPAGELQQQLQGLIDSGALELSQPTVRPLDDLRNNLIAPDKARSLLTIGTAALVVLLAAFGFYGTQRYLVAAGRREYAIRASLGAGPKALGRLVLVRGLLLSLPGLVAGALLAFILVAWLQDDFISREVSPGTVALAVLAGLTLLLLVASIGPARHARRTQPAPLLRED